MSDPTTPVLDPIEDRLRRTFAVRAEDMAPGDTEDEVPDLGGRVPAGSTRPRRSRPLLAAAIVLVVALTAAGAVLAVRASGDAETTSVATPDERPGAATPATVIASRPLVAALQDERNLATAWLLGFEDTIALAVSDQGEARIATDAALADLESALPRRGEAPDGAAAVALDELNALRSEVDGFAGDRNVTQGPAAQAVSDRYSAIISAVLDTQRDVAMTIDDPTQRAGALAYIRALRLQDETALLARAAILAVVSPDPGTVGELSRLQSNVELDVDGLVTDTAGTPHEASAGAVAEAFEASGLLESTEAVIEGSGLDIASFLDTIDEAEGWHVPAFLDEVESTLTAGS